MEGGENVTGVWKPPDVVMRYRPIVDKWCVQLGISQGLVLAVIHWESGGNPLAILFEPVYYVKRIEPKPYWREMMAAKGWGPEDVASSYGLMQIMYPTAQSLGCPDPKLLFDPEQNVRFGVAYLAGLKRRHGGSEPLMLAHYNGGLGGAKAMLEGRATRATNYARKVGALAERYRAFLRGEKAGK